MNIEQRTIAVISPAGAPDPVGLQQGLALIRSWGFKVLTGPHLGASWRYTAGTAMERIEDLRWALETPNIDFVWIARGGFGVQHCLHALPDGCFDDRTVIGCSDATALLQCLHLRGCKRLVHGPMVDTLATTVDDSTRESIQRILRGDFHGKLVGTTFEPTAPVRSGKLLGGNLTMLASLCGTPWQLQSRGAILMLEDVTEHAFRLDRSLHQLIYSGALEGVEAIVLGEFTRCYLPAGADYTADELVQELMQRLGVPIVTGAPFGHDRTNLAWPYGQLGELRMKQLSF
jgi:muramoyltetrapeptide carboxypeptidase